MWTQDQWFSPGPMMRTAPVVRASLNIPARNPPPRPKTMPGRKTMPWEASTRSSIAGRQATSSGGTEHRNLAQHPPAGVAHHPDAAGIDERFAARAGGGENGLDGVMIAFGRLFVERHGGVDDGVGFGGGLFEHMAVIEGTAHGDAAAGLEQGDLLLGPGEAGDRVAGSRRTSQRAVPI
jgi:hypothetical protein